MKNKSIRRDLFLFFRNPDYSKYSSISSFEKLKILFKVMVLTYFALVLLKIPVLILQEMDILSVFKQKTGFYLKSNQPQFNGYKPYFLISTIFFVPLIEEIAFRLCLAKFKVNYFIVSVSVLLGMLTINFFWGYFWIPKSYLVLSAIKIVYILIFAVLTGGFLLLFRKKIEAIEPVWNKNAALLVYFMSILFAVGHINNLKYEGNDWLFMPLILAPFFVYGLSFAYLRIRLGIIYSIALHFIVLFVGYGLPEIINVLKFSK